MLHQWQTAEKRGIFRHLKTEDWPAELSKQTAYVHGCELWMDRHNEWRLHQAKPEKTIFPLLVKFYSDLLIFDLYFYYWPRDSISDQLLDKKLFFLNLTNDFFLAFHDFSFSRPFIWQTNCFLDQTNFHSFSRRHTSFNVEVSVSPHSF